MGGKPNKQKVPDWYVDGQARQEHTHTGSGDQGTSRLTCFFLRSLRAAMSSGASDGTLVTTPVPECTPPRTHTHKNTEQLPLTSTLDKPYVTL